MNPENNGKEMGRKEARINIKQERKEIGRDTCTRNKKKRLVDINESG